MSSSEDFFQKPRQKEWGVLLDGNLISYGYDGSGTSNSTNSYKNALRCLKYYLYIGTAANSLRLVEIIPYDFSMLPTT